MQGVSGGQGRSLAALLLAAVLLAGVAGLVGCAAKPPPPPPPPQATPTDVRDVLVMSQDVAAYFAPETLDRPVLAPEAQDRLAARLRERHFAPWHRQKPAHSRADALWGLAHLRQNRHFGENLRPLGPSFLAEMEALIRPETYPNALARAVATANTSLRVLPTVRPGFLKPTNPGEGYPFDYWQNSGLLAGTPLLVTHKSADGAWVLVEGRTAAGWVSVADIAFVDEAFVAQWEALPLAAVLRENAALAAAGDGEGSAVYLFAGRIGTLLPLADLDPAGLTLLGPARGADGRAVSLPVRLAPTEAAAMPLPLTPRAYAGLAGQLMGQPYGWGGYLGNRDCSALLLDLYAPFGIFLPRNSHQQSREGLWSPFGALPPQDKEAQLLAQGAPLLTLLHKPGHILLYLGQKDGRAVVLHDVWGLRTKNEKGVEGRFVLGRVVITTLEPGLELPDVARSGTLLPTMDGMTLVGATPVPEAQNGKNGKPRP